MKNKKDLKLGKETSYQLNKVDAEILDSVENPHIGTNYVIRLTCPEFTSICPVTSQPDFARLIIDYIPNKRIVESKALKLYLFSYRNHGAFHEDCTVKIAKDIINCIKPKWLRISGYWYPRGGIPIDVFFQSGELPKSVYIPETQVDAYRGR
ncbi:MAG: NADPH-dependent 7-cyano-7-deazaguanine reductase QueF [Pelagibacterales bacterium]|nr:NADPH-dependent 7-cyano-7-deazaguanine reductase QueF [Pelagibacterales bacterium]